MTRSRILGAALLPAVLAAAACNGAGETTDMTARTTTAAAPTDRAASPAPHLPLIDAEAPAELRTATFALG